MSNRSPKPRSHQRGSALIEGALTLTTLVFLIAGTMDIGQVLFRAQFLTVRAQQAARYAAVRKLDEPGLQAVKEWTASAGLAGIHAEQVLVREEGSIANNDRRVVVSITTPVQSAVGSLFGNFTLGPFTASALLESPGEEP